jgi:hypothetical protein
MLYSVILLLFLPSISAVSASSPSPSSSSSSYIPFGYDYRQATELQIMPQSNTTTTDNTITFVTPEIRINYPSNWDALPGIPTSPYVDSIVTFTLLPENNNNNNDTSVNGTGILNIAKHALFHESVELEEYVGTQVYFLRNTIPGFNLLELNKTTLDGKPAYQAVYTGLEGTDTTETMKLWVRSGSTRYIVTYSANVENFSSNFESVRNILGSLRITGAEAGQDIMLIREVLNHIPPSSQENIQAFSTGRVLSSVFDSNLVQFMQGSIVTPPSNFTKLPASYTADDNGSSSISVYYYLSPSYLSPKPDNPETNEPYKLLLLMFTNNNKLITGPPPIDYKVSINGTNNFSFEEQGTTSTGADIKILKGTSFVEATKDPQQYSLAVDIQNLNR